MPEQLEIPQGQEATVSAPDPNPEGFPTFGDLPEPAQAGPRITFAEDEPDDEAPTENEPVTEPGPATASASPVVSPPAAASPTGSSAAQDLFQSMVAYDQYKEAQKASKDQAQASHEWQPPTIPDNVAEEILTDPAKMKAFISERDKWHRNAAVSTIQPLAQELQQNKSDLGVLVQRAHESAWNEVRDMMQARGVEADKYYGPIMTSLQQNPKSYNQIATDPRALKSAVEYLHLNSGQTFTNPPETPQAPPSAGRTAAAPPKADATASSYTTPEIQQVEKTFGIKFNKSMREAFKRGEGKEGWMR
jgi:hypothetical protein